MPLPSASSSDSRLARLRVSTHALAAVLSTLLATVALAQPSEPRLRINGYGTFGLVHSSDDSADFNATPLHVRDGAGHTDSWSPKVDSRLAVQAEARLFNRVSGIAQVMVEQHHDGSFTPTFEWAYLQLEATPAIAVKAGRIVLPALMTSGYRKVGFATPWIRPPQEVYQLVPVSQFDGIDAVWNSRVGEITNNLQLAVGSSKQDLVGGFSYKLNRSVVLSDSVELDALTLFASVSEHRFAAEAPAEFERLMALFNPETAGGKASDDVHLIGVGFRYEPENWLAMGEWAHSEGDLSGKSVGWYLTAGYRFGALMPYLTYASHDIQNRIPGLDRLPLDGSLPLDPATLSLVALDAEQQRTSFGLRWDIYPKVAIKMEYDIIDLAGSATGFRNNFQPDFRRGEDYSLFSAAVQFLF